MLDLKRYFVKEHVGFFKGKGNFDIINPDTKERVGIARPVSPGGFGSVLKAALGKEKGPAKIVIQADEKSEPAVEIRRPWCFLFSPKVHVYEGTNHLGYFKKKKFSIGGGLNVFDGNGKKIGDVQGSWRGGTFTFKSGKDTLGEVSKKYAGAFKEMFTSADNYMVSIGEDQPTKTGALLLAAAIVLDSLYYDGGGKGAAVAGGSSDDEE